MAPAESMSVPTDLLFRGALALALALIIGFQRQRSGHFTLAGIRTFPLIGLVGFFSALLSVAFSGWVIAAGLLALAVVLAIGAFEAKANRVPDIGITTEVAALVVYLAGAYLAVGERIELAVAGCGITALLLYFKEPIHGVVEKMESFEIRAVMNFVLIAFVILPLLPDKAYDRFGVLNPREIWAIVVLIAGISLVGYTVQRAIKQKSGAVWIGILGGLISSTATTVTYSRRAKTVSGSAFAVITILVASTVAFLRILVEVMVVAPGSFQALLPPLGAMFAVMTGLCFVAYHRIASDAERSELTAEDPFQLKVAIVFGFFYALILYASAFVGDRFGDQGLYLLSMISGLIDVDAITISTSQLIHREAIPLDTGWRVIMIAALSNLAFKGSIVALLARGSVRWKAPAYFLLAIAGGIAILLLWPPIALGE